MTTAVSEILKQAESLSAEERMELAARLAEQPRPSAEVAPPISAEESDGAPWFSLSNVQQLPLNETVTMRIRVRYEGRGKPMPYDLSDYFFEDEEEDEAESLEKKDVSNEEEL
ncbi:MAG: hypothetical protein ACRD82_15800 [Blastocatellia bacterium]